MIRTYASLTEKERALLFAYLKSSHMRLHVHDFEEMQRLYGGEVFDGGRSHFSCWEQGEIAGALGVITREIATRSEVFMNGAYVHRDHGGNFTRLLARCLAHLVPFPEIKSVKLGISSGGDHLLPFAEELGFCPLYTLQTMRHNAQQVRTGSRLALELIPLTPENARDFCHISNAAFATSPNGATLSGEEVNDLVVRGVDGGVCRMDGENVGIYQLHRTGRKGSIEAIAIHPDRQGRGIGTSLLKELIHRLYDLGAEKVQLMVASSNDQALNLYRRVGFQLVSTESVWLELQS